MSWVPLLGSGLGSLLGGFLSDFLVRRRRAGSLSSTASFDASSSHGKSLLHTLDATSEGSGESPPPAGSAHVVAAYRRPPENNISMRRLVAGVGNLLATPVVVYALTADFPACFLVLIFSGLVRLPTALC